MKELKRLTAASFMVFVLTMSTYAGIIDWPAPSPPAASNGVESSDVRSSNITQGPEATGASVTNLGMNLLQQLLLVF
jgi:hypothetical protein